MVVNSTYTTKESVIEINKIVGAPFSLFKKIKMGGIGSKRMIIDEVSPNLEHVINSISCINYGNIELRPKGILIHISKQLVKFTWTIPYYQLIIYKINGASIHAQGKFIHFRDSVTFKENKTFFNKLFSEKIKYSKKSSYYNTMQ